MDQSRGPRPSPSTCSSGSTTPRKEWVGHLAHVSSSFLLRNCIQHRAKHPDDAWPRYLAAGRSSCAGPRTAGAEGGP
eukprot:2646249-Amphidinium_carterae.1